LKPGKESCSFTGYRMKISFKFKRSSCSSTCMSGNGYCGFNKKFIYENPIFDKEMYQIYKVSYANRQESDYTIFTKPVKENVIKSYEDAKRFIKEVTSYIKEKTSKINDNAK